MTACQFRCESKEKPIRNTKKLYLLLAELNDSAMIASATIALNIYANFDPFARNSGSIFAIIFFYSSKML